PPAPRAGASRRGRPRGAPPPRRGGSGGAVLRREGRSWVGSQRSQAAGPLTWDPRTSDGASAPHEAVEAALLVARGDVVALVVELLALGEGDLHLRSAVLEVEPERDDGVPLLLDPLPQRLDLAAVEEEAARARRLVVGVPAHLVGRDVEVAEHGALG